MNAWGAEFIRPSSARRYSGLLVWLTTILLGETCFPGKGREAPRGTESMSAGLGAHSGGNAASRTRTMLTRPRQRTLPRLHKHMLEGPVLHVPTQSLHSVPRCNEDLRSQPKQGHGGPDQRMRGGLDTAPGEFNLVTTADDCRQHGLNNHDLIFAVSRCGLNVKCPP